MIRKVKAAIVIFDAISLRNEMLLEASTEERRAIAREVFGEKEDLIALSAYFDLYDSLTRSQTRHAIIQVREPVLRSHEDVLQLLRELKANHQSTYTEFRERVRVSTGATSSPDDVDVDYAINIAVHLTLMIDCTVTDSHSAGYEIDGYRPVKWKGNVRFSDFVSGVFSTDPEAHRSRVSEAQRNCNMLKGWKLRKRAHVTFQPTDDLREHLLYDPQANVVRLFRHTAFLKAQLRRSASITGTRDMPECLAMGTLPPQLLLETLHSLQFILFPSFDQKSFRLLESLVHGKVPNLDADCLSYDGLIREMPANFEYRYWGSRLVRLHQLARNPKPRSRLGQWVERHTSERNALYVALLGLFLAVLFGFLGVVIGIVQTWIAYQAWKYPQQLAA